MFKIFVFSFCITLSNAQCNLDAAKTYTFAQYPFFYGEKGSDCIIQRIVGNWKPDKIAASGVCSGNSNVGVMWEVAANTQTNFDEWQVAGVEQLICNTANFGNSYFFCLAFRA